MGWIISRFRDPRNLERAKPWDETVINGTPYDPNKLNRNGVEHIAAGKSSQNGNIPEEVKRRQLSLVTRYIAAVRAR